MGYPDGRGRCHTAYVTDEERKATGRSGGYASRGVPDPADVPLMRMGSRKERAAARAEIASLAKARVLSPPVASVVLTALKHADEQQDRAAQLELDRKGRRLTEHKLRVSFDPSVLALASQYRPVPRMIPASASVVTTPARIRRTRRPAR